ncbi:hypothetical protein J7W19_11590 [Streptomyces mobaraensis NBRC 13819 = DSM 40847]|uniref:Secreted protein n=2 Tax=Streptomyces mobaraensis TaxID=35621 RepID=A0A5N5WCE2_STRMB|nr:hypothetical protein [Streptomyces mobaraensis]EME98613.1 hypothetical protein H340_20663 [Streptomyces mobaraensis NBRC 13819 = DSM 40847]KAB7849922.1 hypothetical protein FRZ00_04600 [Streptomyces mobaraensis]QTT73970.1 hypothetical protein J7W19_11590 [Streptomyces mobaraensis NBRC 13819 = DSM 40847]
MRTAALLPALAAALLLTAAAPATAAPHGISRTYQDPAGKAATHTLLCPGREHAHSGGAQVEPHNYVASSAPTADRRGWTITTEPLPGNTRARKVTLYVLCA